MSKLSPKKISVEDFDQDQSWISKVVSPLNEFIQQVLSGWNNGITVEDNLFREIKELKFINSTTAYPIKFKPKFTSQPKGMNVIYFKNSNGVDMTVVPCVNWRSNNSLIELTSIGGLTTDHTYTIRLEIIYG